MMKRELQKALQILLAENEKSYCNKDLNIT